MIYLLIFMIFLLLSLLVMFFVSARIMINSTKQDSFNSHFLELGLIFNVFRLQFVYQEKQKTIHFMLGNWNIFSKSLVEKKPTKKKKKKIKPKTKKSFAQKVKSYLKYKSLRLFELKNHLTALLRSFKNPQIKGRVQIGFTNPMHTGLLMGGYSLLSGIWTGFQKHVVFEPVFTNSSANWQLLFSTRFIIARLAWRGFLIWNRIRKIK